MTEFKSILRKRLRVIMAEEDISTKNLALTSGVSIETIRKYLHGETTPTLETACKLAVALNCTPNDLCGFTDKTRK